MEAVDPSITLARHYLSIEQPEKALAALERGASDLEDWEFWYLRGEALRALERREEAEEAARRGLALAPESIPLLQSLANSLAAQQDLAGAETVLLEALRLDSDNTQLLCRYSLLLAQGRQLGKADLVLAEAGRQDPDDPLVIATRLSLLHVRGNDRASMRETRRLLRLSPGSIFGHYMLGTLLLLSGRTGGAGRYLQNAAREYPEADILTKAQTQRFLAHPLLWPLRPFQRLGSAGAWLVAMALFIVLRFLGLSQAAFVVLGIYLALAVYSWISIPLLRRWYRRRGYDIDVEL
jgi:tetratricopeptide (TPR) repeat protein